MEVAGSRCGGRPGHAGRWGNEHMREGDTDMSAQVGTNRVRVSVVGRVFVAYWHRSPDILNVREATTGLARARLTVGAPLIVCAYVPEWVEPPPTDVRRYIIETTPEMLEYCESIHTVQEGDGILPSAFRTVGRAMVLAGGFRGRVFIHASLEDFLTNAREKLGTPEPDVRRELERMGAAPVLHAG